MCNVVICDDQRKATELIQEIIKKIGCAEIDKISLFTEGKSLLEDIADGNVDAEIIVMDIKLGRESGIEMAERLLQIKPACQIIFVSGYDDYFEDVYEVEHVYFLKKPIDENKMKSALMKSIEKLANMKTKCMCISNKSGNYVIPFDDIYSLEKDKRKIIIKSANEQTCSFYGKFEEIEVQLKGDFVRCHHSFVINLAKVKALEKDYFLLRNGKKIPISRTYMKLARTRFIKYIDREY